MKSSDENKAKPAINVPVQISKAPSPISPVNTSRPMDLRNHYTIEPVNWTGWRRLDRARLWEAACLVAGFEPPTDDGEAIWAGYQIKDLPKPFHEVWNAVNRDDDFCRHQFMSGSGLMLHTVHVGYFALWAMTKGFQIATELREIVDRYRKTHPDIVARFNEAYGVVEAPAASSQLRFVPVSGSTLNQNKPVLPPGLTKQQICIVFDGIHFDDWSPRLADPSSWLKETRLQKGSRDKKHPSLWDPVAIAVWLADQRVGVQKLDRLFDRHLQILKAWRPIWEEKARLLE